MRLVISMAMIAGLAIAPAFSQQRGGGQRQQGGQGQRQQGQRGGGGQQGGQRGGGRMVDPIAKAIDANGDGTLSESEIAGAAERVRSLDTDGNGSISADEIRTAMRAAMGGGRGAGGPGNGGGGGGPGSPGSSTLERVGLQVGQMMPDITIHDAKGAEFRMADLKGKYSVIVFGCLT